MLRCVQLVEASIKDQVLVQVHVEQVLGDLLGTRIVISIDRQCSPAIDILIMSTKIFHEKVMCQVEDFGQ